MSKHTPGPWVYCTRLSGSENHKGYYIKSKKFVLAFEVIPVDSDGKEGQANARLIAAAPELLEALYDMTQWVAAFAYGQGANAHAEVMKSERMQKATSAIAKATGETE